jgi:integrase
MDKGQLIGPLVLIAWRDILLVKLAPKTVSDVYLASVRTILNWAVREDRLTVNPAEHVRQEVAKKYRSREKGFTLDEGVAILRASYKYAPKPFMGGAPREFAETSAAKKWVPLLCAHTGARVSEMTQLRREDVRKAGDICIVRISPDAGTVKTGLYRDVPLHKQIVDLGFVDFVNAAPSGPLFVRTKKGEKGLQKARMIANRIAEGLKDQDLVPKGVSPNHGWRHRFKTVGREEGLPERIIEAICGHAGRTAGDDYGDVTITAMWRVIGAMPSYEIARDKIGVSFRPISTYIHLCGVPLFVSFVKCKCVCFRVKR